MKTYAKGVDITNPAVILPWVMQAFDGKYHKRSYIKLLVTYGEMDEEQIYKDLAAQNYSRIYDAVAKVAVEVARRIAERNLNLRPLRSFERLDGLSGKVRQLVSASSMQQIMDYVAVGAMGDLLKAKIMPFQCASIEGRGQLYGKKCLENWIRRDKKSRHIRQGDITKCFASITRQTVMRFLNRDIRKNRLLLWLVDTLLATHALVTTGLAIGSFLSQWLTNYVLSYLYRFIDGLCKARQ